ncbi:hypothetical protein ACF0H5_000440 [Mactra antiquata]
MSAKGKQRKRPSGPPPSATSNEEKNPTIDEEGESQLQKFELELVWCIEQLRLGLETQNPSSKQAMEATKILKILLSAKAPMIKKRQAMRNAFGDYRKKMAEMEKRSLSALRKSTVIPAEESSHQKSIFYKKSSFSSGDNTSHSHQNKNQSNNTEINKCDDQSNIESSAKSVKQLSSNFQFNFNIDTQSDTNDKSELSETKTDSSTKETDSVQTSTLFHKSDNSFRFNFQLPE